MTKQIVLAVLVLGSFAARADVDVKAKLSSVSCSLVTDRTEKPIIFSRAEKSGGAVTLLNLIFARAYRQEHKGETFQVDSAVLEVPGNILVVKAMSNMGEQIVLRIDQKTPDANNYCLSDLILTEQTGGNASFRCATDISN